MEKTSILDRASQMLQHENNGHDYLAFNTSWPFPASCFSNQRLFSCLNCAFISKFKSASSSWKLSRQLVMRMISVGLVLIFSAISTNVLADMRCESTATDALVKHAQGADRIRPSGMLSVLPGGDQATLKLSPMVDPRSKLFCARLLADAEIAVDVKDALKTTDGTVLTFEIGEPEIGPITDAQLIVIAYALDDKGEVGSPEVAVIETVKVSSFWFALVMSVVVVLIAYGLVMASKAMNTGAWSIDPVFLTAGYFGRASLSQFQIFGFTLLILGLLVYILLRTSVLSDISTDILLLLGVSAGGAAGSRIVGVMKNRIDGSNWAWLIDRGWLTDPDRDENLAKDKNRAKWRDLLCTGGNFDVYSFQLLAVSGLVAAGLLGTDLSKLAEFRIPEGLLPLLGLSNVVYLGGKAVLQDTITELNTELQTLQEAEAAWLSAVAQDISQVSADKRQEEAIKKAPQEYQQYMLVARKAATTLKSIYGEETKFDSRPIIDDYLLPRFP